MFVDTERSQKCSVLFVCEFVVVFRLDSDPIHGLSYTQYMYSILNIY